MLIFLKFSAQFPQVWFRLSLLLVLLVYNCLQFGNSFVLDDSVEEVVSKVAGASLEKANLLFLSKQAIDKDKSLKTSLLKVLSADNNCEMAGKCIWSQNNYIKDEINLGKVGYLEISLRKGKTSFMEIKRSWSRLCLPSTRLRISQETVGFISIRGYIDECSFNCG